MDYQQAKASGFRAPAGRILDSDLPRIGSKIGVGEDVVHALIDVESSGRFADAKGRLPLLYEPHVFYRCLPPSKRKIAAQTVVNGYVLARPSWKRLYPKDSYPLLLKAMQIDEVAALKACSWGSTQVLGENYKLAGFASVTDMVAKLCESQAWHIEAMVNFIKSTKLDDDLRKIEKDCESRQSTANDWIPIAAGYNGKGFAANAYHVRLSQSFNKWKRIKDTPWSPDEALRAVSAPDKIDGKSTPVVAAAAAGGTGAAYFWSDWTWYDWAFAASVTFVCLGIVYWIIVRPVLRRWGALNETLFSTEEISLWGQFRLSLKGMKSYLWGRVLALSGPVLAILSFADFIDLSYVLPDIKGIPAAVYVPLGVTPLLGLMNNWLTSMHDTRPEEVALSVSASPERATLQDELAIVRNASPDRQERAKSARKRRRKDVSV